MPEPVEISPDKFYDVDGGGASIFCGRCIQEMFDDTAAGRLEGDEVVTPDMVEAVSGTAYQCDSCLEQGEGYDNLIDNDE